MKDNKTKSITMIGLFVALICVGAYISIPVGPAVPISLQNFFVFMAGLLLAPGEAALAALIYMILGLIGVPIFAGFTGGIQSIFKPSFGFIIAFIFGAYVISIMTKGTNNRMRIFLSLIVCEIILYAIGLPYMYFILKNYLHVGPEVIDSTYKIFMLGCIPYLPGDLLKIVVATIITPKIKSAISKSEYNN